MRPGTQSTPGDNPYFASATSPDSASPAPAAAPAESPSTHVRIAEPVTPLRERPPELPSARPAYGNANRQQSSIGLRRVRHQPSRGITAPTSNQNIQPPSSEGDVDGSSLVRPNSQGTQGSQAASQAPDSASEASERGGRRLRRRPSWLPRFPTGHPNQREPQQESQPGGSEYDSRIVDLLDVVDPEVSTLTSITNLQNSLFIPSLGRFVNRRPTYDVSWAPPPLTSDTQPQTLENVPEEPRGQTESGDARPSSVRRTLSITSRVEDTHFAVLPHGASLEGWSQEDIDALNDHVRHMLHSRRSKFKRSMQGFGRYVRRPLGFLVTLYATLITLFGLAWVLFLIGWIYVGSKQDYLINIIDYILVALFALVGDGLAPFRAIDTYHLIYIAHYHRLSWKLRQKLLLPDLRDHNDLPTQTVLPDLESGQNTESIAPLEAEAGEVSVLSPQQQEKLTHHQNKYAKSHTFYRPHETETHFAFPLKLLVAITCLLDLHSCLQISLGATTYGIKPEHRPFALTTVILCCSITVNATAGLLIWIGDKRTRKKDVAERMARQELTEEAMQKVKKDKQKEAEEKAAAKEEEQEGGRKSISLPRLSLDKWASVAGTKAGSSSSPARTGQSKEGEKKP